MTSSEYKKLQKKYNKPKDPKQQEKYRKYEEKIKDIMRKPPNDQGHAVIAFNEILDPYAMGVEGYFFDPEERAWCLYCTQHQERSNRISFFIYKRTETEEEAFQCIYESLEENVKRYERELEKEKNNRMTREEFLNWYGKENRKEQLAEKGSYQILWNREPEDELFAIGYYLQVNEGYIKECIGDLWVAYVIIDGKCRMEMKYKHETRAIYMMSYWIQLMLEGYFDKD